MIPQSAIHIDGNLAWVVTGRPQPFLPLTVTFHPDANILDRPCDTCYTADGEPGDSGWQFCTDCDGTGRHTFDIEVEADVHWDAYRVHVVPGMVLPIVGRKGCGNTRHICIASDGETLRHAKLDEPEDDGETEWSLTLPPDARPGMRAVQLEVH